MRHTFPFSNSTAEDMIKRKTFILPKISILNSVMYKTDFLTAKTNSSTGMRIGSHSVTHCSSDKNLRVKEGRLYNSKSLLLYIDKYQAKLYFLEVSVNTSIQQTENSAGHQSEQRAWITHGLQLSVHTAKLPASPAL